MQGLAISYDGWLSLAWVITFLVGEGSPARLEPLGSRRWGTLLLHQERHQGRPDQRMLSLWRDKHPAIKGLLPPEHRTGHSIWTTKGLLRVNRKQLDVTWQASLLQGECPLSLSSAYLLVRSSIILY